MKRINNKALILMLSFLFMSFTVAAQDILGTWRFEGNEGESWFLTFKDGGIVNSVIVIEKSEPDVYMKVEMEFPGTYTLKSNAFSMEPNGDKLHLTSYKVTVNGEQLDSPEVKQYLEVQLVEPSKRMVNSKAILGQVSSLSEDKLIIRDSQNRYVLYRVKNR